MRSLCGRGVPFVPGSRCGCHHGDRLEAYPAMGTGWKPIPRLGCRDGDRLEAYPTVVVSRYLDCKIGVLAEDFSLAMDVIP
jgi:hypothetical protein